VPYTGQFSFDVQVNYLPGDYHFVNANVWVDHLCGLVFRDPAYRSRGPSSIPGATKFSEK
jgi:hypothetical protein